MTTPNTPNAAERPSCTEAHVVALSALAMRFASGNSVPVERTHITRAEWDALCAFAREQDEIIRAWHARELPAESVSAELVAWTTRQPTDPGAYRVRGFNLDDKSRIGVVEVRHGDGALICNIHRENTDPDLRTWYSVADLNPAFEWQRLHPQPSTPGAVSDEDVEVAAKAAFDAPRAGADDQMTWEELVAEQPDFASEIRDTIRAALESFAKRSAAASGRDAAHCENCGATDGEGCGACLPRASGERTESKGGGNG